MQELKREILILCGIILAAVVILATVAQCSADAQTMHMDSGAIGELGGGGHSWGGDEGGLIIDPWAKEIITSSGFGSEKKGRYVQGRGQDWLGVKITKPRKKEYFTGR